jgi:hypothetical protein
VASPTDKANLTPDESEEDDKGSDLRVCWVELRGFESPTLFAVNADSL